MDEGTLRQYKADNPPTIVPLAIKPHFDALNDQEKKYAHYISRAALSGTRINLRQVSPESEAIYDFIITLHKSCNGKPSEFYLVCSFSITRLYACVMSDGYAHSPPDGHARNGC